MPRVVNSKQYESPEVLAHARGLLGKILVRTKAAGRTAKMITEVEAYDGETDLACHASRGRTPRTDVLYRAGGIWYVYLCYGIHEMLNLVVGPKDYPAAVLIRGVSDIIGPGRVTKQLGIDRKLNGLLADPSTGLHLEDAGVAVPRRLISATPRIGVDYAGPIWSVKPWRFSIDPATLPADIRSQVGLQNCSSS